MMKHYKNSAGAVFAYDVDGSQDYLIGPDLVLMTENEVTAHVNRVPSVDWADRIAQRRWQAETGGMTLNGLVVATDDRAKLLLSGAVYKANHDPAYLMNWKTDNGFIQIPADQILVIASAMADHVQACFDREAELVQALADGVITADMLEQGWPT